MRCSYSAGCSMREPTLAKACSRWATLAPKTVMVPSEGWARPVMDFMMVVFPEPLGPSSPHHLPPFHGEGDVPGTPAVGVNLGEMIQGQYSVQGLYSFPQGSQRPAKGGRTPKATGLRGAPCRIM